MCIARLQVRTFSASVQAADYVVDIFMLIAEGSHLGIVIFPLPIFCECLLHIYCTEMRPGHSPGGHLHALVSILKMYFQLIPELPTCEVRQRKKRYGVLCSVST